MRAAVAAALGYKTSMQVNDVTTYELDGRIAVLCVDSAPVNALSAKVRQGLSSGLAQAMADPGAEALVLICAGRTFFAGADISEFGKPVAEPSLRTLLAQIEAASKPVVAALHGTALGGGLELALAAHWRIAAPTAGLGLPEVKLGLLPGAGGTQRLPRLVGVEAALEMITDGRQVGASEALAMGLVDALANEGRLRQDAVAFAQRVVTERRPLPRLRDQDARLAAARQDPEVFARFRAANARRFRGFEAPEAIIRAIEAATTLPFDQGMARERELFDSLMQGSQSAAQRHLFFAERKAGKLEGAAAEATPRPIRQVGVVGAGTMGGGIATTFANAGLPVRIVETSAERLTRGLAVIRGGYEASARRGKLANDEVERRMGLIAGSVELEDLAGCDLVIEAVFEQMAVKTEVFRRLDALVRPGAILATNTSYLDVDAIAAATERPGEVLGLHFFSPANVMRLLEIVRGRETADDVLATAVALARTLGKTAVIAGNAHGFIGNRMLAVRQRQAEMLILEGATPWQVDAVLQAFGFPMGPFAMRDLVGLDIGWDAAASSSSTVREILNEMGRHGQKSGGGFYDYDQGRTATPSPIAERVILDFAAARGVVRRPVSDTEIQERCLYAMVNEGAKILEAKVAVRASDIDVVWTAGYGWPAYRGGPMFWADLEGLAHILQRLDRLQQAHGEDFRPAPLIARLASEGASFGTSG
jgi:3-hydroxyacyl-CoA dehydrogenase